MSEIVHKNAFITSLPVQLFRLNIHIHAVKRVGYPVGITSVHNCHEIHHAIDPGAEIRIENEGKVLSLLQGDILWILPGTTHRTIVISPGVRHYNVLFDFEECISYPYEKGIASTSSFPRTISEKGYWLGSGSNIISSYLLDAMKLANSNIWGRIPQIQCLMSLFITSCYQSMLGGETLKMESENHTYADIRNALPIITYIRENYSEPLTLENLSKIFYISPRQINRYIQELCGLTFKRIVADIRIGHAKLYLKNTSFTAEKICELVGFDSVSYFYRVFKSMVGMTVTEYRKKNR
ncbi:MAG: AraC family transcriptional regulator [Holosporales bacterium]|jgi:AraC-like DNA-binding protein|nr:AraC family transcriptional regulator [Holosporales bacterium]